MSLPDHFVDVVQQLFQVEWLLDKMLGATRLNPNEQHRICADNLARRLALLESMQNFEAGMHREREIQQDDIGPHLFRDAQPGATVSCLVNHEARIG